LREKEREEGKEGGREEEEGREGERVRTRNLSSRTTCSAVPLNHTPAAAAVHGRSSELH